MKFRFDAPPAHPLCSHPNPRARLEGEDWELWFDDEIDRLFALWFTPEWATDDQLDRLSLVLARLMKDPKTKATRSAYPYIQHHYHRQHRDTITAIIIPRT